MPPSRRAMLGLLGASTLTVITGCTAAGSFGATTPSDTPSTADSEHPSFEIRLSGPEGDTRLFDADDVAAVGDIQQRDDAYYLPIELTDEATVAVSETVRTAGVAEGPDAFEIVHRHDGEEMNRLGITPALAESIAGGNWAGASS